MSSRVGVGVIAAVLTASENRTLLKTSDIYEFRYTVAQFLRKGIGNFTSTHILQACRAGWHLAVVDS